MPKELVASMSLTLILVFGILFGFLAAIGMYFHYNKIDFV